MTKRILAALTAIVIIATASSAITWVGYKDVSEMLWGKPDGERPGADLVITGIVTDLEEITEERELNGETQTRYYTITTVKITEVILGEAKANQTITIKSLGWAEELEIEDGVFIGTTGWGAFLEKGQEYLLFLSFDSVNPDSEHYWIMDPQGHYLFDSEGNILPTPMKPDSNTPQPPIEGLESIEQLIELVAAGPDGASEPDTPEPDLTPDSPTLPDDINPPAGVSLTIIPLLFTAVGAAICRPKNKTSKIKLK